jgi:FtsP/CotA-like multicopper oxidase with cupredoxin domain
MRSSTSPVPNIGRGAIGAGQGQWLLPNGQICMKMLQVAGEGGLLPYPVPMDSFEIWPAKRREVVVDFTRYADGSPTKAGDVVYLVNTLMMTEGIKPDGGQDPAYKVPLLKFVIGDLPPVPDYSQVMSRLRPVPLLPSQSALQALANNRQRFDLKKNGPDYESRWTINNQPFDAHVQMATVNRGAEAVWEFNTGGGWVHPMHLHEEEHRVVARERNGVMTWTYNERDDMMKEDVLALGEFSRIWIYRKFRTFHGKYVAHCHNLAHEDHAMIFGWEIIP